MTVLRTAYVEVMPKTDKFEPELNKRIRRIDASAAAGKAGEQAGDSFGKRMGGALTAAFAAAGIGTAIGGAVLSGLDVGAANDKLRAQLNLTKDESGRLGKAAGELYSSNYGESMGEVNDAIAQVIKAVPSLRRASVPVLKEISAGALDIARVFDQDVGGVTSAVSSMLASGLAPNAKAAMDTITKGFQIGLDKGGDFLDTLTEYSVQFTKLGLDGPASLGVIGQLLDGGARSADLAADAIKEFSIRAIDGSTTSAEGYKLLGLNAKEFTKQVAAGGPAAKAAFATVVAKLNEMKDPVKRNTAGVALFGTQFEDLGDAFRALDVSAATDGMGKLAGATAGIGDQSAQGRIQSFIRTVQTGFVNVVGGQVLPKVLEFGGVLRDKLMPSVQRLGDVVRTDVLPRLREFGGYVQTDVLPRLRDFGTFVTTQVVPAVQSLAGWIGKNKDFFVPFVATLGTALVIFKTIAIATKVWAAAQVLLNLAMAANPIGLVVIALAALVGGLVFAYKNSETFRNIVQGAWKGIQAAVSYAWNNVIKPAVSALVWYLKNVVAPVVMFLWRNVIQPAWAGIQFAIKAAWVVIQVIFAGIKLYLTNVLFPVIRFLYNNVVKPVFSGISATIGSVWNKGIKPVFQALGGFIGKYVAPAFRTGVGAIATAWDKLKAAASAPVRFVVDQVLNKGIIGSINWLAKAVGVKDRIPTINWGGGGGGSKPQGDKISGNTRGDGYGVGDGKGIGDGLGSLLAGPAKWLSGRLGLGRLVGKFGDNPFVHSVLGGANRMKDLALGKLQSLLGELGGGGSVGAGGLRSGILGVLGSLRDRFGGVPLISGLRPGATTLSGNRSYHALGRAIDIAPVRGWAEFIHGTFGPRLKELITPWQDLNLLNGQPHTYTGAVWNQHNFAGGNAHVHAAMANGGVIHEPVFGIGRSGRTYAFGERGPETVVPNGAAMRLHPADIAALASALRSSPVVVQLDGREIGYAQGRQASIYGR